MMYSYVINIDDGAAPNPYHGYCTLAICKPAIRRVANFGDWIIGTGSKKVGNNKLIYAMKVTEMKNFKDYFDGIKFDKKKPKFNDEDEYAHVGDNIYRPVEGGFKQLPSVHSDGYKENLSNKKHDLGDDFKKNDRVLISDTFYYFGNNAVDMPPTLQNIIKKGQGHKSKSITQEEIEGFEEFIS